MSSTPHDALFKHTFSQPEHAAGELRSALPPSIVGHIDFDTLTHEPSTFVRQERLAELVRVRVGEEVMGAMKTAGELLVEKGRVEGRVEGRREALLDGLRVRFGSVPPAIAARIEQAGIDELTGWNERLFAAKTLADLFGDA